MHNKFMRWGPGLVFAWNSSLWRADQAQRAQICQSKEEWCWPPGGDVLGPGLVGKQLLCVVRPRPLQGCPGENTGQESTCTRIWMLLKTLQLRLLWGPFHHHRLWVSPANRSSMREPVIKTIPEQIQQKTESVFLLTSSHLSEHRKNLKECAITLGP